MAQALVNESEYIAEALRLREKHGQQIGLLLGFESEWIRASSRILLSRTLRAGPFDFFVGSVHHVHTIPIDYNAAMYRQARDLAGGSDESLFESYFDWQLDLLREMKPPVIGHFDLVRLKSDLPNKDLAGFSGVWDRILRNLDVAASYGGILEINMASLRKGLKEPYPQATICKVCLFIALHPGHINCLLAQAFLERAGRFCLSDDSHCINHVSQNYDQILDFLEQVGIQTLCVLKHSDEALPSAVDDRFPRLRIENVSLVELKNHVFWNAQDS